MFSINTNNIFKSVMPDAQIFSYKNTLLSSVRKAVYAGGAFAGGLLGKGVAALHGPSLAARWITYQAGGGVVAKATAYATVGALTPKMLWAGQVVGAVALPVLMSGVEKGVPYLLQTGASAAKWLYEQTPSLSVVNLDNIDLSDVAL